MLTKVTITDNSNTPLRYVADIWENGTSWEFKPGVNIVVGENGCGKSTLLKLIAAYGLCADSMKSQLPDKTSLLKIEHLYHQKFQQDSTFRDGCIVNMDYQGTLFRYTPATEFNNEDALDSFANFSLTINKHRSSMGESMLDAMGMLIKTMNEEKDVNFPIKQLKKYIDSVNYVWSRKLDMLLDYYKANRIEVKQDDFEFTVLMDEPDRNLDITHIKELYNILSYHRPMTQLIAVVHNPVLIYKLAQTDVNFIEMTPDYLYHVKNLIKWAK